MNVIAKYENDSWKIADDRVFTGRVCPASSSGNNTPEPLRAAG